MRKHLREARRFTKHIPHYIPLAGIFTAGVLAFWLFSYDKQFQVGVVVSVAAAHVAWGIVHHYLHRDLSWEIIIEYVTIALLGLAVLLSLVFRS